MNLNEWLESERKAGARRFHSSNRIWVSERPDGTRRTFGEPVDLSELSGGEDRASDWFVAITLALALFGLVSVAYCIWTLIR